VHFETGPNPGIRDNFGWHCREGAHPGQGQSSPVCIDRLGTFTEPVFEYPQADPGPCSITGGYVVRDLARAGLYGRYLYSDLCTGELRSLDLGPTMASGDRSERVSIPLPTSFGEDADCRIYVASFDGPVYRLTEPAGGATTGCAVASSPKPTSATEPTPNTGPTPALGTSLLTLDLGARTHALSKRLTFFATASADSAMVATGKGIKQTTKELATNQKTKVKVKLRRAKLKQLQERLERKGKAKAKVTVIATDQAGATTTDKINVKLRDQVVLTAP
jgi:hypothetical protein